MGEEELLSKYYDDYNSIPDESSSLLVPHQHQHQYHNPKQQGIELTQQQQQNMKKTILSDSIGVTFRRAFSITKNNENRQQDYLTTMISVASSVVTRTDREDDTSSDEDDYDDDVDRVQLLGTKILDLEQARHHQQPITTNPPNQLSSRSTATTATISTTTLSCNDYDDVYDDNDGPMDEAQGLIRRGDDSNDDTNNTRTQEVEKPSPPPPMTFCQSLTDRAGWLIGLLVFQSLSSFILARNEALLQRHPFIVQFLTMLVGAGGNAGNQASVGIIRGIATGAITTSNCLKVLRREFTMGMALSLLLGCAGLIRAKVFLIPWMASIVITLCLFMIVLISVIVGATLPLCMQCVGIDPAHSSTSIQVIMDITGVLITVNVSTLLLDSKFHDWLENKFNV